MNNLQTSNESKPSIRVRYSPEQKEKAITLLKDGSYTQGEVAEITKISIHTIKAMAVTLNKDSLSPKKNLTGVKHNLFEIGDIAKRKEELEELLKGESIRKELKLIEEMAQIEANIKSKQAALADLKIKYLEIKSKNRV